MLQSLSLSGLIHEEATRRIGKVEQLVLYDKKARHRFGRTADVNTVPSNYLQICKIDTHEKYFSL